MEHLLGSEGINVNLGSINMEIQCTLMWACMNGHINIVELLLGFNSIDVNLKNSIKNDTALMRASREGHSAIVELLLA